MLIVLPLVALGGVLAAVLRHQARRPGPSQVQAPLGGVLGLRPSPDDWGLSGLDLGAGLIAHRSTMIGHSPAVGYLHPCHEGEARGGVPFLVAEEEVALGKEVRRYGLVAAPVTPGLTWFSNGEDISGALPGGWSEVLDARVRTGDLRAAVVADGMVVLRVPDAAVVPRAVELVVQVAEEFPRSAEPPGPLVDWEQPPA